MGNNKDLASGVNTQIENVDEATAIKTENGSTLTGPGNSVEKTSTKKGRGISNNTRATTRLKFDTRDAKPNGLFVGHLESVVMTHIKIGEDTTGLPSFNGLEIPKLTLLFASNDDMPSNRRYRELSFTAIESNVNTIPNGKEEWKVSQVFNYLKHILNVFVLKGRDMTEAEESQLSLSFEDFDDEGQYVNVDVEDVIKGWEMLFMNFATIMNTGTNNNPVFKTKDGKYIPLWIKLLRYTKTFKKGKTPAWKAVDNGNLAFPIFVGEGVIELFTAQKAPSLRIDVVTEDIKPRVIEEPKAPNMPMPPNNQGMFNGGVPMPQDIPQFNDSGLGDDVPF